MARRRRPGGFGSGGGFGGGATQPATAPATAPRNQPATQQSRGLNMRQRQQRRQRRQDKRNTGFGKSGDTGASPIDELGQDLAFEDQDPETMRWGALGVLNKAGVSTNPMTTPFGSNQLPFIEDTVNSWVDEHLGNVLAGDANATWGGKLGQLGGQVMAAAAPPATAPGQDPKSKLAAMSKKQRQALTAKKRKRLRKRNGRIEEVAPAVGPPVLTPQEEAEIRHALTASWAQQTARTRGYDSSSMVAPKRTIQF